VITQAQLLREQGAVVDREQRILLSELQRFLLHPSSGVKEFDQMPAAWSEICAQIASGATVSGKNSLAQDVVAGWHQALDRMTGTLSRQIGKQVRVVMSGAEAGDPAKRLKSAVSGLASDACLRTEIAIPGAAARVQIIADIPKRTLSFAMRMKAPGDRKSTKARLSWLLRQLTNAEPADLHIRFAWPGSSPTTQHSMTNLRADSDIAALERPGMAPHSFDVLLVRELGAKFMQRKNFVNDLLQAASLFHASVGENLAAWQAKPPKISDDRRTPASVSTEAMRDEMEQEALQRSRRKATEREPYPLRGSILDADYPRTRVNIAGRFTRMPENPQENGHGGPKRPANQIISNAERRNPSDHRVNGGAHLPLTLRT
jgi:hypothetical protein